MEELTSRERFNLALNHQEPDRVPIDLGSITSTIRTVEAYDRLKEYLGVGIPHIRLPIFPGKNITVLAETIALNLHLKVYGFHPAKQFSAALSDAMKVRAKLETYLEKDYE